MSVSWKVQGLGIQMVSRWIEDLELSSAIHLILYSSNLLMVTTDEMVADIFTKPVDEATFIKMRAVLLNMSGDGIAKAKVSRLVDALYDALHKKG